MYCISWFFHCWIVGPKGLVGQCISQTLHNHIHQQKPYAERLHNRSALFYTIAFLQFWFVFISLEKLGFFFVSINVFYFIRTDIYKQILYHWLRIKHFKIHVIFWYELFLIRLSTVLLVYFSCIWYRYVQLFSSCLSFMSVNK